MDLFTKPTQENSADHPLAVRMRPRTLDEFVGQEHILSKGKILRRAIDADRLSSVILYGPPGIGKTSLAWCVANITKSNYSSVNATTSGVDELRKIIAAAKRIKSVNNKKTILFIDEIHRFNKAQQDVLLPDVEQGNPILIGATVHNPFFSIASPLLSRSLVCELKSLSAKEILVILDSALKDKERGLGNLKVSPEAKALNFLAKISEGDARRALNALEIGVLTTPAAKKTRVVNFTLEVAEESIQKKAVVYDKDEDGHYDTASAFIKSMRGSDPDAALYWMAKMLYAGEDPRFIARRICILAAEDVGNADPLALVLANAALQISEFVGMPEARIPLAQACIYVSCAPKSNASYLAIDKAMQDIKNSRVQEVPDHLKDANLDAETLGHGQGYKYAHDFPGHFVEQEYTRKKVKYYQPTDIGHEAKIRERMEKLKNKKKNG